MKKKKKNGKLQYRPSLRLICIIVSILLIFLSSAISSAISLIFNHVFHRPLNLPTSLVWLILGVALGTASAFLLEIFFTRPIKELDKAVKNVAHGDLSTHVAMQPTTARVREIRDLFENFNLMTAELSATEILQSDFVSNVSHEFKTPINAIEGYATLLQNADVSQEQQMYVEKILVNTRRLSELVGNILLLSKAENSALRMPVEAYRLDEQIRMALLLLEPKWSARGIEFDVELDPISYAGCKAMMQHVWVNLLDNAIKFSPEGGTVTIRLARTDAIVCTIEDTGPGIAEQDLRHIFDKFFQGDSSHKADGNGLGLALVKRIVADAGGEVRAENLPQTGCRFTVTL